MSDLQDALKWWKMNRVEPFDLSHDGQHAMTLIVEAARRVANPDYYAAAQAVEWVNKPGARETIYTIIHAALGVTEDE